MSYSPEILSGSIDPATHEMLDQAKKAGIETIWDRLDAMQPQCGFGETGLCSRNCAMGPCRISPFAEEGPRRGVCGADRDVIVARFLDRMIAAGCAAHSDHGRGIAETSLLAARGEAPDYKIRDEAKLKALAAEFGISTEGRTNLQIAEELGGKMLAQFGRQEGALAFTKRAPETRQDIWTKLRIMPRGIDREVVEPQDFEATEAPREVGVWHRSRRFCFRLIFLKVVLARPGTWNYSLAGSKQKSRCFM
jgi:anaerobic carbon-monoxide dehydrogenase catalytic subunit